MSFFVTSVGNGQAGGNFGGLVGADLVCTSLAIAAGSNKTWRAYLSTYPLDGAPEPPVNARDRIGAGPWFNFRGDQIAASVDALHTNPPPSALMFTELGEAVPLNEHDILTGSDAFGYAMQANPFTGALYPTCRNWTSASENDNVFLGHVDWECADSLIFHWSHAHSQGCSPQTLASTGGSGRVYCFAVN